ncbi:DNA methyltransferase [Glutamicibacter ardleyensis]|uniref:DNA methyltransferase n=1 Tax=Glutamicibacter ardleyensis TaxID=225894 RepID=UPI003FD5EC26
MAKTLSLNEIRKRSISFVVEWRDEAGEEKQQAQSFVRDLLQIFGITGNKAALYEKRAQRSSTGNQGYIDALVPGTCLIEMKSRGKDLALAESQALDYVQALNQFEEPRWIITSDFFNFRVLDLQADGENDTTIFTLEDLPKKIEVLSFLAGYQQRSFGSKEQETASIKAAKLMADLYEALEGSGYDDHEASVFLVRTLFALYADDSGVWERDMFYEFLEMRTNSDGSDLGGQLTTLYQALNKRPENRQKNLDDLIQRFPYVNGGIFAEPLSIPAFDSGMRTKLLEACAFNWSAISPAIFGSLFQAVKDKKARRDLGEHYTTETNILKTIGPLFLDGLRQRFVDNLHSVPNLKKLRAQMKEMRFLDPACGCGNFLVVAYREMRSLDLQILKRLQELGDTSQIPTLFFTKDDLPVIMDHFSGFEIEEWPARIATTALHLVDHQANQAMELALGKAPEPLPLDSVETIHVVNALRAEWAEYIPATKHLYIMGNPPFLGDNTRGPEQKAELQNAWGGDSTLSRLDYVTGWHAKTLRLFDSLHYEGEWAFVTTNSITQGDQVPRLFTPIFKAGWRIKFAHQTFAWSSEAPGAAAVHCVIVGFTKDKKTPARLFTYASPKAQPIEIPTHTGINAYLLDATNVLVEKRSSVLSSELIPTIYGSKPTDNGNLIVEPEDFSEVNADPIAAKYLHKYVGARELLHDEDRWCLWLDGMAPNDLNRSTVLKRRVEAVRDFRGASKAASTRDYPFHHLFRQLAKQDTSFVCVPRHVSETRKYFTVALFDADVIAGDANFTIKDPDGFQFAVMSSGMFIAWQKAIGGRLESRLRFASTLTWYTFPFPAVDEKIRAEIIAAGQKVLEARALYPERSLASHYNPLAMDMALVKAHAALDRVVDRVFGAKKALATESARQEILFTQYTKQTA